MTADGWPSRYIDVELRGPDPGWIETLFYHLRTLMVENAFYKRLIEPIMGSRARPVASALCRLDSKSNKYAQTSRPRTHACNRA